MVSTLLLWRHGQTDYNLAGRFQGQRDVSLNSAGHAQAAQVVPQLAAFKPQRIVSSDLTRTMQTASYLGEASRVTVEPDQRLREISVGQWEGYTRAEVAEIWPAELDAWLSGAEMRPPGGESRSESAQRVQHAIEDIVAQDTSTETLAIVAHGAVLRGAAELLLGVGATGFLGALGNCHYGVLTPRRGAWVLRSWGRD